MTDTNQEVKSFELGKTYSYSLAGDHDAITLLTVTKVTAKTVTVEDSEGNSKRCKIVRVEDNEFILPQGRHSMAPVMRADAVVA